MKLNFWKPFIWGACVFGTLHLIVCIYLIKVGGEGGMLLVFIDYPLVLFFEKFLCAKIWNIEWLGYFYYLIFGTLMYAFIGGIILSVLFSVIKLLSKIKI